MMTADDLRYSVLQLAMQGKLVEHREEEGTAEALFKVMQADRDRLLSEKKIKKEKKLPEINFEEIPFEIPPNWKLVRVGNVGSWSAGATPSRSHTEYYGGSIPWLKTGDLNDGDIYDIPESITDKGFQNSSVRLNPIGSVLMAMYGATIGKLGILRIEATTNQACCACICYKGMLNKYLFYYLLSQRRNYISMGSGGAQPNISKDKIVNSIMALPPLEEQKRIVSKIEELMPFVDQYADASTKLNILNTNFPDQMKKSILQQAVMGKLVPQDPNDEPASVLLEKIAEEKKRMIKERKIKKQKKLPEITEDEIPFDIPNSWEWVRLGNIIELLSGTDFKPNEYSDISGKTVYITGASCLTDKGVLSQRWTDTPRNIVHRGDLLLVCKGSGYGKTCICDVDEAHIARQIMSIKHMETMDIHYIQYYLQSKLTYIKKRGQGVIPGIDRGTVLNMVFPLPSLKEQQRIVKTLQKNMTFIEKLKEVSL